MKYVDNIQKIAALEPDYLGFIFYEKSKRNFEGIIPELPKGIKKVGVFVNEIVEIVVSLIEEYHLDVVQLHGDESVAYIKQLRRYIAESSNRHLKNLDVIKVFSVGQTFDFDRLDPFEGVVDYFLFDTKGKERGGNGTTFNWEILQAYPYEKPFFLSGGIGLKELNTIKALKKTTLPIFALDVNSQFETQPGVKSVEQIQHFKNEI